MTKKLVVIQFNPGPKPAIAMDKHLRIYAGTPFVKCARCSGCSSGMNKDGTMNCSRAGATPVAVTAEQVEACDGGNPLRTMS